MGERRGQQMQAIPAAKPDVLIERGLPANPDAEKAVLGAILLDNAAYNVVAALLAADDFHVDAHRRLYARMTALREGDPPGPIDFTTITEELLRTSELEAVGGVSYLATLTDGLPRSINVGAYARIVKDKAILRQTITTAHQIVQVGLDGGSAGDGEDETVEGFVARAQANILAIETDAGRRGLASVTDIAGETYRQLDALQPGAISGLATGFGRFDNLTRGLQAGELTMVAARPSMGKSALALNIAANVALAGGIVALFSLEMTRESCLIRILCAEARVDSQKLRSGFASREDRMALVAAMDSLSVAGLFIDDTSRLGLSELRAKARRLRQERGRLSLVIVDHLGLMKTPRLENRDKELGFLSSGLKALAKDLRVPVLALSQLSRAVETRGGEHRPQLSDLRDSGNLEQDSDVVAFLWREEYYLCMQGKDVPEDVKGRAELVVAKQRNGPVGKIPLAFMDKYAAFGEIAGGAYA